MLRTCMLSATLLTVSASFALAHDTEAFMESPPGEPYVQVSDVLPLPEFLPGLGTLFVVPDTLPAGPFLAYDHDGQLSATVFMTPLEALSSGTAYSDQHVGSHKVTLNRPGFTGE